MRFLVCGLGTAGFVFPLIGIAQELRSRGHDVLFATDPAYRGRLEGLGISYVDGVAATESFLSFASLGDPQMVARDYHRLEAAAEAFGPDAILTHVLCNAPLLLRERSSIPTAVLGTMLYLWPRRRAATGDQAASGAVTALSAAERRRLRTLLETVRALDQARALCGMPEVELAGGPDVTRLLGTIRHMFGIPPRVPPTEEDGATEPALDEECAFGLAERAGLFGDQLLLRSVPALEDPALLPPSVRFVGACLWEPDYDREALWNEARALLPSEARPIVYVTLGARYKDGGAFWPSLVAAASEMQVYLLATGSVKAAGDAPRRNVLVLPPTPQGFALGRVQGVVCSGKSTAVLGALNHGLPAILVPTDGETGENAERLQEASCAITIHPREVTPEAFKEALDRILNDNRIKEPPRRLQRAFAQLPGFDAPATVLEQLASGARGEAPITTTATTPSAHGFAAPTWLYE